LQSCRPACARARASEESGQNLKVKENNRRIAKINVHLSATKDEALLWGRNTGLLLDFLLDPSDLTAESKVELLEGLFAKLADRPLPYHQD
jgi:hypothetical protein